MTHEPAENLVVRECDRIDSGLTRFLDRRRHYRRRTLLALVVGVAVVAFGLLQLTHNTGTARLVAWVHESLVIGRLVVLRLQIMLEKRIPDYTALVLLNFAACWLAALLLRNPRSRP